MQKNIHNVKDLPRDERAPPAGGLGHAELHAAAGAMRFVPGEGLVIDLGDLMPDEAQEAPNHGTQF